MKKIVFPLLTSVLFSGSYIAGKYTTLDLEPLTTTLLRYVVALLFLAALLPLHERRSLVLEGRDVMRAMILGLTGIVGYHYFFFLSLRFTEVANTAIINALSPVITGVGAALVLGERLGLKSYLGVVTALAGVLLLLSRGDLDTVAAIRFNKGDLLMLLSVLSWMLYALLIKSMVEKYSGFALTFYATLFGVAWLVLLVPAEDPVAQIRGISRASLLSVVYMGVCGSGLGYLLYNLSIREIGPTRTSSFVYSVIPIIVALLALLVFAEAITGVMAASVALILVGLQLMLSRPPRAA